MKKVLLFDVDGTIVESGQKIHNDMKNVIQSLTHKYDIGIVGGGKLDNILQQMGDNNYFMHYFSECGCVYHENISSNSELKLFNHYKKNLRHHILYPKINILIKTCLLFLSNVDYLITGNFIDLRNGIIYVSLIGMSANTEERNHFIELDYKLQYRKNLIQLLKNKSIELDFSEEITICEGGCVGIGIYPSEYDKTQVLEHLLDKYQEIHYFGDKYTENGNDFNIINSHNVIGHPVDSVQDTLNILKTL